MLIFYANEGNSQILGENIFTMKKFTKSAAGMLLTMAMILSTGCVTAFAANANNVSFETFITSVKAGEFVLSKKVQTEFLAAVKNGNTDKALEIYNAYFDGDDSDGIAYVVGDVEKSSDNGADSAAQEKADAIHAAATATETVAVTATPEQAPAPSAAPEQPAAISAAADSDGDDIGPAEETPVVEAPVIEGYGDEDMGDVGAADSDYQGLSEVDYNALCKMVQAEAGGEGAIGKLLVANVILNRVRSPKYPMTVSAVVSQPGQFQPFRNGRFAAAVPNAETVNAVNRALRGENNAVNVLYFKSVSSRQVWSNKVLAFQHGRHLFYY